MHVLHSYNVQTVYIHEYKGICMYVHFAVNKKYKNKNIAKSWVRPHDRVHYSQLP